MEMYELRTKIIVCNGEICGIKQVSLQWDLTNNSFNLVTCTANNILHYVLRLGSNE